MDDTVAEPEISSQKPERIQHANGSWVQPIRSTERAREVANMRYEKYRKAATVGMVAAAVSLGVSPSNPQAAYAGIVERQTELALSPDARGSTAAANFVAKAIDAMPRRDRDERQQTHGARFTLDLDDEAIGRLLDALAAARKQGDR